jgi:hypothetical protein
MAKLVGIGDLHLGERGNTILDSQEACAEFSTILARITGGKIDILVMNGDIFSAGPGDLGHGTFGLAAATVEDSHRFFTELARHVAVSLLVWVPGNHDLGLYDKLTGPRKSLYTLSRGDGIRSQGKWYVGKDAEKLFGAAIKNIGVAYPNFIHRAQGGWPFVVFTHGHLFDAQILKPEGSFLHDLGLDKGWPAIPRAFPGKGPWMKQLADATTGRILAMWPMNPAGDGVKRRRCQARCSHRPARPGCREVSLTFEKLPIDGELRGDIHRYCEALMHDEAPVNPRESQGTSFLVKGHSHDGICGMIRGVHDEPFIVMDLGGWTIDGDNVPHTHVVVWDEFPAAPRCYALNVGRP